MLKKVFLFSILCMLLTTMPSWGLDLKPGKYEITTKVEMKGVPGGMPAQTMTQCITEQDPVPAGSANAQGCKITDMKTKGNTVTYTMECEQQGMKTKTTGEMTYKGDTFEGTSKTEMGPAAGGMTVTTKISGKRIGKCE
jgi:hypothetical protein